MSFEFKGKVIAISSNSGDKKDNSGKWYSQQIVIEEPKDKYPDILVCEVFGEDKIAEFGLKEGQEINAYFNTKGQQWNGKWFGKNQLWKVDKLSSNSVGQAPVTQPQDDGSDLPF